MVYRLVGRRLVVVVLLFLCLPGALLGRLLLSVHGRERRRARARLFKGSPFGQATLYKTPQARQPLRALSQPLVDLSQRVHEGFIVFIATNPLTPAHHTSALSTRPARPITNEQGGAGEKRGRYSGGGLVLNQNQNASPAGAVLTMLLMVYWGRGAAIAVVAMFLMVYWGRGAGRGAAAPIADVLNRNQNASPPAPLFTHISMGRCGEGR